MARSRNAPSPSWASIRPRFGARVSLGGVLMAPSPRNQGPQNGAVGCAPPPRCPRHPEDLKAFGKRRIGRGRGLQKMERDASDRLEAVRDQGIDLDQVALNDLARPQMHTRAARGLNGLRIGGHCRRIARSGACRGPCLVQLLAECPTARNIPLLMSSAFDGGYRARREVRRPATLTCAAPDPR
jgi:hypothetical protein